MSLSLTIPASACGIKEPPKTLFFGRLRLFLPTPSTCLPPLGARKDSRFTWAAVGKTCADLIRRVQRQCPSVVA